MTTRKELETIARAWAAHLGGEVTVEKAPAFRFNGWDTFGPANYRIGAGWRVTKVYEEDGHRWVESTHLYLGKDGVAQTHSGDGGGAEIRPDPTGTGWRVIAYGTRYIAAKYGDPEPTGWYLPPEPEPPREETEDEALARETWEMEASLRDAESGAAEERYNDYRAWLAGDGEER